MDTFLKESDSREASEDHDSIKFSVFTPSFQFSLLCQVCFIFLLVISRSPQGNIHIWHGHFSRSACDENKAEQGDSPICLQGGSREFALKPGSTALRAPNLSIHCEHPSVVPADNLEF